MTWLNQITRDSVSQLWPKLLFHDDWLNKPRKQEKLDWATANLENASSINEQINMLNLIKHSSEAYLSLKRANRDIDGYVNYWKPDSVCIYSHAF